MPDDNRKTLGDPLDEFDTATQAANPSADSPYTELDEQGFSNLDEENDREVASRGGHANLTQKVGAEVDEFDDDADIREGELPITPPDAVEGDNQ